MSNPTALRNGLAVRLRTISSLKQVHTRWPSIIIPPCAIVTRGVAEPEQNLGRGDLTKWTFELYLFVTGAGGFENAQDLVDPYLATSSTGGIYGAIHADRTLGGVASYTSIKALREDADWQVAENVDFFGFVADVEVWSS